MNATGLLMAGLAALLALEAVPAGNISAAGNTSASGTAAGAVGCFQTEDPAAVCTNPQTSYSVYIMDNADLLSSEEEARLADDMTPVTQYGGAAFISENVPYSMSSAEFAEEQYVEIFGYESGTLFLIDMTNRNIWIYSDGEIYRTITRSYANTITDNVYRYATEGNYYECASEAFREIGTLLEGGRIAQPMRYICAALLAVIFAFLVNYLLVRVSTRHRKTNIKGIKASSTVSYSLTDKAVVFDATTKTYSPPSSSSGSGGGGSGGGGGGGSGGGGGGGGHGF